MQRNSRLLGFFRYAALTAIGLFLAAPFVWMVLISLHESKANIPETVQTLVPERLHWENYPTVLFMPELPVFRFLLNSLFVTGSVVIGQLLICSLAAYGFSRIEFKGRDVLFSSFLLSLMFAGVVTQIPVYLMMRSVGWLDTYGALIVPGLSSAFNIFLLRQFFIQIPRELDQAAKLDGASDLLVYWKVIMPMSKPSLATAAAFTFVAVWTDFFWPLLATNSVRMRTLEVGLSVFKTSFTTNWPLQMTAAVIVMFPLAIVFLIAQKQFVRGISMGSIK